MRKNAKMNLKREVGFIVNDLRDEIDRERKMELETLSISVDCGYFLDFVVMLMRKNN
jgi:hypothetical protein